MRHAIASLHLPAWTMAVLLALMALMGCASQVPVAIRTAPADAPDPAQVRQDPARFTGHPVRWGGTIIGVENRPDHTDIEVLAHPLDRDGEPRAGGPEQGRSLHAPRVFSTRPSMRGTVCSPSRALSPASRRGPSGTILTATRSSGSRIAICGPRHHHRAPILTPVFRSGTIPGMVPGTASDPGQAPGSAPGMPRPGLIQGPGANPGLVIDHVTLEDTHPAP